MFQHYLLIAFRAFRKNKSYSVLNVLGLTLGITCSLAIFLYVYDELTYDQNHVNGENIYRLNNSYHLPNGAGFESYAASGPMVSQVLVKDFPEILKAVRINGQRNVIFEKPGASEVIYETVQVVDSNFFEIFTFPFIAGNPDNALNDVNTLVINRKIALKYFNKTDVVGEELHIQNDTVAYRIAGVMEDPPANTHLKFDMITSLETLRARGRVYLQTWWSFGYNTYLLLQPGTNAEELEKKIKYISRNYIPDQEDGSGYKQEFSLTPLSRIHLYSQLRGELEPNSKAEYVFTFLIVGIFILVIACINFMNMATARSAMRAKEIGLRKVAGALRQQLIGQFLGEAFFTTFLAVTVSIVLLYFMLPMVNEFSGKSLKVLNTQVFWMALAAITVLVALLAGSYPSLFLSAFKPVETLKGNFKNSSKGNGLRKALVIFQFAISIFLIAGTLIITRHLDYIRSIDLGFDKSKVLFIPARSIQASDFKTLKEELLGVAGIETASLSSTVPGREMNNNVVRIGWDQNAKWSDMRYLAVDFDFMDVYNLSLVDGRSFRKESPSDENESFMVNESGMRRLGFSNAKDILGQQLSWMNRKGTVIGVLKDFHFMGANVAIEPFIVVMNTNHSISYLSVKTSSGDLNATIGQIEKIYHKILPERIFEYSFLDQEFDKQYKSEDRFMAIFTFFAVVAILIACLGLYGLGMFMSELRFKEVGIRKVLGASEKSLLVLLTKDFIMLVAVAFVLAVPVSWWAMNNWLSSFPYRENINPILFGVAGIMAVVIAILTVSYNAFKASVSNPVKALRSE